MPVVYCDLVDARCMDVETVGAIVTVLSMVLVPQILTSRTGR